MQWLTSENFIQQVAKTVNLVSTFFMRRSRSKLVTTLIGQMLDLLKLEGLKRVSKVATPGTF